MAWVGLRRALSLKRVELPGRTFVVAAPPTAPQTTPPGSESDRTGPWVGIVAVLCSLAAIGAAWKFGPCCRALWSQHRLRVAGSESALFRTFEAACHRDDPHTALRALLAWLDHFLAPDPAPTAQGLAARAGDPHLAADIAALAEAAYGRTTRANVPWSGRDLARRTRRARARLRRTTAGASRRRGGLPPLNPGG